MQGIEVDQNHTIGSQDAERLKRKNLSFGKNPAKNNSDAVS